MPPQGTIQGQNTRGSVKLQREGEGLSEFNYSFQPAIDPFKGTATLQGDINQCIGSSNFSGIIGPDDFNVTFDNGVVLQGRLDSPLSPPQPISGQGVWSIS
ncbi:hypothetical protein BJ944DRAFT_266656 [Cunninghamella echinulata]|nr:hypothetical protein BJ944DRAFT_266656 [Cunninghamella echinulata]